MRPFLETLKCAFNFDFARCGFVKFFSLLFLRIFWFSVELRSLLAFLYGRFLKALFRLPYGELFLEFCPEVTQNIEIVLVPKGCKPSVAMRAT